MTEARAPHVEALKAGQDFVAIGELRDIAAVEVADADPSTDSAIVVTRVAGLPDAAHFAAVAASRPPGRPTMFQRRPGGLALCPAADKPYWFRVSYRAPVKREARDPEGQP